MNKRAMSAVVQLDASNEETGRRGFRILSIVATLGILLLLFARMSPAVAAVKNHVPPVKKVDEKIVRKGDGDDNEDANNGCGNDDDRSDDNNGWCGLKPHTNKPDTNTNKPDTNTNKPDTNTNKPDTNTNKPDKPSKPTKPTKPTKDAGGGSPEVDPCHVHVNPGSFGGNADKRPSNEGNYYGWGDGWCAPVLS